MKRVALVSLYIFIAIHFLKDITQDILKITSPLDIFGNIEENITFMSPLLQKSYFYGLGGLSFLAEILILIFMPKIILEKANATDKRIVTYSFIYLLLFLLLCASLDPNINPLI